MDKPHYILCHHLVAFLDVQGQKEQFKRLKLPKNPEEEAKVAEVLKNTAGFVVSLRDVFLHQFEAFEKGAKMGAHSKEPVRPKFVGFSDSFVSSVPLRDDGAGLVRVVTVFSALSSVATVMLTSLASKHPLRGGIDVGLATDIGPQEIYGTALERAYALESEVAQYPRIVIGDEFWKYLNLAVAEFENGATPVAKAMTAIVKKIMELIAIDDDGRRILDYMGKTVRDQAGFDPGQQVKHMIQPAYDFVVAEEAKQIANGNEKLMARYKRLRAYIESRLLLWGLAAKKR